MKIKKVTAYLVDIPLKDPYHLSFTDLNSFATIFVEIVTTEGCKSIGESVPLPGYSHETLKNAWTFVTNQGGILPGICIKDAITKLTPFCENNPYSVTPILTALEFLDDKCTYKLGRPFKQKLLGTLNSTDYAALQKEIESLLGQGYTTLKVKVGMNLNEDISRTRFIQDTVGKSALIRIDANQGYNFAEASHFVNSIDPRSVELFEQPFKIDKWAEMVELNKVSPLPLMLDESIHSEKDLDMAITLKCAEYVKFKLMKVGSVKRLESMINKAFAHDLKVVLGNGVAGEIGCIHEGLVAAKLLQNAGEMNGFLKQKNTIFNCEIVIKDGYMLVPEDFSSEITEDILGSFLKDKKEWLS
ncbi:MAG: mandelate racemase/muconate lactonizing enzyme family protein [Peptococcaceae bacterium]